MNGEPLALQTIVTLGVDTPGVILGISQMVPDGPYDYLVKYWEGPKKKIAWYFEHELTLGHDPK